MAIARHVSIDGTVYDIEPSGNNVTGVKGDSETTYRTGNVNITKSNIGLGNVGNFKAVSTVASQGLSDTEKSNARANIGAGTSSFSGSYTDLTNKPTIPTVNNATLTIQKNGTTVKTFTANASSNVTANITVPTKTSELTNDSGYITNAGVTGVKGNSETSYRTGNVNITKANIGLGSVGNFKAVSTATSQGLTATEQSNARANITASGQIEVLKNTLNKNAFTITTPTQYKEIIVKCYVDNGYACDLHFYPGVDYNYGDSTLLATASSMLKYGNTSYIVYGTIKTNGVLTLTYDGFTAISGYKVIARK